MSLPARLRFGLILLLAATGQFFSSARAQSGLTASVIDLGPAPASTPLRRMQLVLARTTLQESALTALLAAQQDQSSGSYRHWLTPEQFGAEFGPSDDDLARLTTWLNAQGFSGIRVNAGRTLVEFSGSAASVQRAFGAAIHQVRSGDRAAYVTASEPKLPPSLAPLVRGFASLTTVPRLTVEASTAPQAATTLRRTASGNISVVKPDNTIQSNAQTYYGITPYDFAALYDVLPLWNASTPIDGTGETIAVVGATDIHSADFVAFRTIFSLPLGNTNTPTGTQYLNVIYNGNNPGLQDTEFHADSDTQWASAAAKSATIDYVASQSTEVTLGIELSAAYIVDNNLAPILVDSYFTCEAQLGSGGNAFYNALWQQAAAQGITVVTASGDSGAAGCDVFHAGPAVDGPAVSGVASTPYDMAVGGTEFYAPNGLSQYFNPANDAHQASVSGYIPEIPWNDSCANPAINAAPPYTGLTAEQVCNQAQTGADGIDVTAGTGGGASSASLSGGTAGYPKPAWQTGPGVPADGVRDVPDVALVASQGRTNSYYLVCQADRDPDGASCNVNFPYSDFAAYGGTEVAAPAFAGVLALAVQHAGGRIGLPNQVLYTLAARQATAGTSCNSTGTTSSACIFHDVTLGTNATPCVSGSPACVTTTPGDAVGLLSVPSASPGYDLASGLGSVDAANLVNAFSTVAFSPVTALLNVSPSQAVHGSAILASVSVTSANGTPTGEVSLNAQAANGSVGGGPLVGGTFSQSFRDFPGGSYGVQAHYGGDSAHAAADSNFVSLTITPEPSTTTIQTLSFNPPTGITTNLSTAPYGGDFFIRFNVQGASGQGMPTGNLSVEDTAQPYFGNGNVTRLNSSGYTEVQTTALAPGTHVFTALYQGDPSFSPSAATPATLVITPAPTVTTLALSTSSVSAGSTLTLSATVATQGYGYLPPSGTLTFSSGLTVLGTSLVTGGTNQANQQDQATATLTISAANIPLGADTIVATYSGDANYLGSSSAGSSLQTTPTSLIPTATFVFSTPNSVSPNGSILFTALVSPQTPSPTGTVQFAVDGNDAGTPQPIAANNYAAALTTTVNGLSVGLHSLTAAYSGDAQSYRSSNSPASSFLVTSPGQPSSVSFTANPTALVQGTFINVNAGVLPLSPSPTGTVQLVIDGGFYGSPMPVAQGAATLPLGTTTLQVGTHVLGVYYSGDNTYTNAYAQPVTITIRAPGTTPSSVAIAGLSSPVPTGSAAVFSGVVSPSAPTPSGILQVILDGGNPGAPILVTGTSTPLSIAGASLPAGPHTVQLFYSGDNTYDFSTSASYSFTVATPVYVEDFSLSPAAPSQTVVRLSSSAPIPFTLTPIHGFNAPVTFSCSALPVNTSCTFTPATLTMDGVDPATGVLQINLNTGMHGRAEPFLFPRRLKIELALALFLGLPVAIRRRTRRTWPLAALLFVTAGFVGLSGCGGGSHQVAGLTPVGTYQVLVTASSPSVTHTSTVSLTVLE
jgi:subtilase family serine protease